MKREEGKDGKGKLSRRGFLQGGVTILAASASVGVLSFTRGADAMSLPKQWDRKTDVVILGAGIAGLSAAIEAAKTGAKVEVLEKEPIIGGSSAVCGGQFAFAPTSMQREKGIKDSTDLFLKDMMEVGAGKNDRELVKTYVDGSNDAFEFLKGAGAKFVNVAIFPGHSVPRCHYANPADVLKRLKEEAVRQGVTVFTRTSAKRLFADCNGLVVGLEAAEKGKDITIQVRKAVILATGGFAANPEMLEEFSNMPLSKCLSGAAAGSTGDGLCMALELGSATKNISIGVAPGCALDVKTRFITMPHYNGAICLNKEGKRFVNESIGYMKVAEAALSQTDALILQIADGRIYDAAMKDPLSNKGAPVKADTLEALAPMIGLDPKVLRESVDTYNRYVDAGKDPDFKRTTLVGVSGKPVRIETPPFYGFITKPGMLATQGGIKVNAKAQVVRVFGDVIPGLYACGEIMGGVHGVGYATGTAMGKGVVFGRIAGKNGAAEKTRS